jgi:acetyl-CoA synthetase
MLGVSPTLIRTLRAVSRDVPAVDLSAVRVLGSTGEPWDPESYEWLARDVFGGRVPVINFSGGTEVGGSFLCPYPVEEIRGCSLGGPALGMDVDVVDDTGQSVRGRVGELVCRQPWPAMTRGVWKDDERYREAYWSAFPGMWRHGDYALVDSDGSWFILGRSDDVMNVAGKRVAPAEIESVIAADPAVSESAVVGIPDAGKGEAIWVFYVPRPGAEDDETVSGRLRGRVAGELGKPFAPSRVLQVRQLPKTRSAKILRRAVRAAVLDADPGDLSGAENPEAVEEIRLRVKELP